MWQTEKQRPSLPPVPWAEIRGLSSRPEQTRAGVRTRFPLNSGWISPDFAWSYQPAFLTSRLRLRFWLSRSESKHGVFFINIRCSWQMMASNRLCRRHASDFSLYYEIVCPFGAAETKSPALQENLKFTFWSKVKRSDKHIMFWNIKITNLNILKSDIYILFKWKIYCGVCVPSEQAQNFSQTMVECI